MLPFARCDVTKSIYLTRLLEDSCGVCVVLFDCVTRDAVYIMRIMIAACFLIIVLSLTAGLMDLLGPTHIICQALQSTAGLSVLSGAAVDSSYAVLYKVTVY